jgi:hypothetical protein
VSARWHGSNHHPPCPGGCGELADECMTPGCGSPFGGFTIEPAIGSSRAPAPLVIDWTAEGKRPAGQPGTVNRNHRVAGWSYPAVEIDDDRVMFYRDTTDDAGHWMLAPPILAGSFEPGEDWQASCDHLHGTPWRTCDTEADCISLRKESEPRWGDA